MPPDLPDANEPSDAPRPVGVPDAFADVHPASKPRSRAWLPLAMAAGIVGALLIVLSIRLNREGNLQAARSAFDAGEFSRALETAVGILKSQPDSTDALLIAGYSSTQLGEGARAVAYFDRLPHGADSRVNDAHALAANIVLFELGMASNAERRLRRILEHDPRHASALSGLGSLLGLAGRRDEAVPIYLELIRQDRILPEQLTLLGAESGAHQNGELHERCLALAPRDPIPLMGLAWQSAEKLRFEDAERRVRLALQAEPELLEAHVLLGRILLAQQRSAELMEWHARLPPEAEENAEIWRIRGDFEHENNGASRMASRCYWESIRRNPNVRASLYGIVGVLQSLGEQERAEPFAERLERLQALLDLQSIMFDSRQPDPDQIRGVAEKLEELGRIWESYAWSHFALEHDPASTWARERRQRLGDQIAGDPPLTLPASNPAFAIDLSDFPLPELQIHGSLAPSTTALRAGSSIRFQDVADDVGLTFQYFNGGTSEGYQYEFSGGGVAVLDYDLDGWPDLHLTQGCAWPPAEAGDHLDALFRNMAGRSVLSVAAASRIHEDRFSQGAAVGDFDQDGFPDLYVGNIGGNRLFHNNGDGTFVVMADDGRMDGGEWTAGCLLADISGDGLPDLYDVNYLGDADVFERVCRHSDGVRYMCPPFHFRGAQDRYHANAGNGIFDDQTESRGFLAADGKGLGAVAADFDGTGRLGLFVANDVTPNFYFQPDASGDAHVSERGVLSGLAYGDQGQVQSCMGVAAGDLNDDGLIDLFVTNFAREFYTLYIQSAPGLFRDEIRKSGIADATLPVLGFGAQTIDGDLDGRLDLIVANGHVQDERNYTGDAYKMHPQFCRNVGGGRFEVLEGRRIGEYFEGEYLGRGLARLDFNRDGREDFAVSHLDVPAALLLNQTESAGGALVVRLVGARTNREAIGVGVSVASGGRTIVRQLTAGDGYQASNQRILVFGLGEDQQVDRIEVRWPSGMTQELAGASPGDEWTFVEDRGRPLRMPSRNTDGRSG